MRPSMRAAVKQHCCDSGKGGGVGVGGSVRTPRQDKHHVPYAIYLPRRGAVRSGASAETEGTTEFT